MGQQLAKQSFRMVSVALTLVVVLVGFLVANNSLAWFSKNKSVDTNGLSVRTTVSPNLIIAKSEDAIAQPGATDRVDFKGTARTDMIAVTRDETVEGSYLKYLDDHFAVDHMTGNAKDGMTLAFADVPTDGDGQYFVDYTVYIASAYAPLPVTSLTATISIPEEVDEYHPSFNAVSIDLYVGEVSPEGYIDTMTVYDCVNGTDKAILELMPGGGTIPLNTEGHIKVIMRCYFDGALQDPETGYAYVNSYTVSTATVVIGVDIAATENKTVAAE